MTLTTNRQAALAAIERVDVPVDVRAILTDLLYEIDVLNGTVEPAERVKRAVMRLRVETPDMPLTTAWRAATSEVEAEIRAQQLRLAFR
jgi:hypothetical protein